jgi:hypothetical protein
MKVYGTVNNNSSLHGKEDAPLLSKSSNGTKGSNFKRLVGATLLASGCAFAIASGSNNRISGSSAMMRLGDALDDAKAGAFVESSFRFSILLFKGAALWWIKISNLFFSF